MLPPMYGPVRHVTTLASVPRRQVAERQHDRASEGESHGLEPALGASDVARPEKLRPEPLDSFRAHISAERDDLRGHVAQRA